MIQCPKCKSVYIRGPFYRPAKMYRSECLEYVCQCGYRETTPTRDQERKSAEAKR